MGVIQGGLDTPLIQQAIQTFARGELGLPLLAARWVRVRPTMSLRHQGFRTHVPSLGQLSDHTRISASVKQGLSRGSVGR